MFPKEIENNFMNFNQPKLHDRSYCSRYSDLVCSVCESVSKYLLYLRDQMSRTLESQNVTEKEASIDEFVVIKAVPQINLFWSECFSKIKLLLNESDIFSLILINFLMKGCETSLQLTTESGTLR